MEVSPLVQQARPSFQPKISRLYEELFVRDEDVAHPEGFWSEFFLLRPDKPSLRARLATVQADDLLHFQHETQQLFLHAVQNIKSGKAPSDDVALDTLTVFLAGVLAKRYTNPSSDIIAILAGLDEVDTVFSDFANAIESIIRNGRSLEIRKKAIQVALSLTSGAYQTSLVSYFTHRDLFPACMKYVQDADDNSQSYMPFLLLGLLVNYNKFEYRNPYRLRMEDFVNEAAINKIVLGLSTVFSRSRNEYGALLEEVPEGWSLSSALTFIGLGVLAPIKTIVPVAITDDNNEKFNLLPSHEAAVLIAVYDFANANKLFCYALLTTPVISKSHESPFSGFLSLSSYILHHAHRSQRATLYGLLNLTILRIIIEDVLLCKRLCDPTVTLTVRLCRQRQPLLPPTPSARPGAAQILDIAIDTITHNLRRRLDLDLYVAAIALAHRLLCCLSQNHIIITYHWSLAWQSLLSLLRFLTTYATDLLSQTADIHSLLTPLLRTIALAVLSGPAFLPASSSDDLFYKLLESHATLISLKSLYHLPDHSPIDVLLSVSGYFKNLVEQERGKGKIGGNMGMREVTKVIRMGLEGLVLPEGVEVEGWDKWREGEERGFLKRVGRVAVEDVRGWVGSL